MEETDWRHGDIWTSWPHSPMRFICGITSEFNQAVSWHADLFCWLPQGALCSAERALRTQIMEEEVIFPSSQDVFWSQSVSLLIKPISHLFTDIKLKQINKQMYLWSQICFFLTLSKEFSTQLNSLVLSFYVYVYMQFCICASVSICMCVCVRVSTVCVCA